MLINEQIVREIVREQLLKEVNKKISRIQLLHEKAYSETTKKGLIVPAEEGKEKEYEKLTIDIRNHFAGADSGTGNPNYKTAMRDMSIEARVDLIIDDLADGKGAGLKAGNIKKYAKSIKGQEGKPPESLQKYVEEYINSIEASIKAKGGTLKKPGPKKNDHIKASELKAFEAAVTGETTKEPEDGSEKDLEKNKDGVGINKEPDASQRKLANEAQLEDKEIDLIFGLAKSARSKIDKKTKKRISNDSAKRLVKMIDDMLGSELGKEKVRSLFYRIKKGDTITKMSIVMDAYVKSGGKNAEKAYDDGDLGQGNKGDDKGEQEAAKKSDDKVYRLKGELSKKNPDKFWGYYTLINGNWNYIKKTAGGWKPSDGRDAGKWKPVKGQKAVNKLNAGPLVDVMSGKEETQDIKGKQDPAAKKKRRTGRTTSPTTSTTPSQTGAETETGSEPTTEEFDSDGLPVRRVKDSEGNISFEFDDGETTEIITKSSAPKVFRSLQKDYRAHRRANFPFKEDPRGYLDAIGLSKSVIDNPPEVQIYNEKGGALFTLTIDKVINGFLENPDGDSPNNKGPYKDLVEELVKLMKSDKPLKTSNVGGKPINKLDFLKGGKKRIQFLKNRRKKQFDKVMMSIPIFKAVKDINLDSRFNEGSVITYKGRDYEFVKKSFQAATKRNLNRQGVLSKFVKDPDNKKFLKGTPGFDKPFSYLILKIGNTTISPVNSFYKKVVKEGELKAAQSQQAPETNEFGLPATSDAE